MKCTIPSHALGGPDRPDPLGCHLCPSCAAATDRAGGVGRSARERAVLAHLERTSSRKADRLRLLLSDDTTAPGLPGWRALSMPRMPNAAPWGHLRRVLDRL